MDDRAKLLRERAKNELLTKGVINESVYGSDLKTIIEELSIYQIELEHQNQELIDSQEKQLQINDIYIDLFENAPVGYVIVNTDQVITKINRTACQLINQNTILNSKFTQLIHPDFQDEFYFYFKGLINRNPKDYCDVKLLSKQPNSFFFARITGNRQIHSIGQEQEFRLAITDISTEKELEQNLIKAKEKAEENDNLKSAFLANMSHEIRTPMNGIIGFADLLKDSSISEESKISYIDIIERSGNRLLDLINELIDISKIESGQMQLNISPTNISDIFVELNLFFLPETKRKNLTLIAENQLKSYETYVLTDKEKLFAILINLIKNSIKYTNQGSIKFGVYRAGHLLKFYIKDTGIGIPDEKKHIIFQRFRQVEETAYHEGTGLGLSIAKGMVELLGGKVGFASTFNKGSLFYFSIPYHEIDSTTISENSLSNEIPSLEKFTIVVAEDDTYSSVLLGELLKESKAKTHFVENGIQLMDLLHNITPDMILLDINMPLKNGYDCLKEIHEKGIQTKIIAVTAYALNEEKEKILQLGCDGYISKPYKKIDLYNEIVKHIC